MQTISIKLEDKFLKDMEILMKKHRYSTKTEFIRDSLRERMKELEKEESIKKLEKLFGSSKKKTTEEMIRKVRELSFKEL